jgi:hypothetical protein
MTSLPNPLLCVVLNAALLIAVGVAAADPIQVGETSAVRIDRRLELQAHRALQVLRTRPGVALAPFTTDGCSGGMSRAWSFVADTFPDFAEAHRARPPWEACCITHDRAYHAAGPDPHPNRSFDRRLLADGALHSCVSAMADERSDRLGILYGITSEQVRAAYSAIAEAMFLSVRLGGGPCSGLPWRWGFGWPHCD